MSIYFTTREGRDLWNPANVTGRLFHDQVNSVARILAIESGLGPIASDEVIVDEPKFLQFVKSFAEFVLTADPESGGRAVAQNCLGIAGALAEKLGGRMSDVPEIVSLICDGRRVVG
jgi:hypothetical protein